jgi:hypothetical protein
VDDVAGFLKSSTSYVYKQAATGILPSQRISSMLRFDPEMVRAFARGEVRGKPGGGLVILKKRSPT